MQYKFLKSVMIAMFGVAWCLASAQDYPTHRGGNQRQGANTDAAEVGIGRAFLTWWRPNLTDNIGSTVIRNNTSTQTLAVGTTPYNWQSPALNFEAAGWYNAPLNAGASDLEKEIVGGGTPIAGTLAGVNLDEPPYLFARATPSVLDVNKPYQALNASQLATFTWTLDPAALSVIHPPQNYFVSMWLPVGPTRTTATTYLFPQRYFVVGISYDADPEPEFVEVVDTYAAGTNFVRLGNGGLQSERAIPYDGTNPIKVTLYNTIPRDANGNLLENLTQNPTPIVYADAVRATPAFGSYTSSPVVANVGPTAVSNIVLAALNISAIGNVNGESVPIVRGEVTAYDWANGSVDNVTTGTGKKWTFRPTDVSEFTVVNDAGVINSAGITVSPPGSFAIGADATIAANSFNGSYLEAPVSAANAGVRYDPVLADGDYDILVYLPGDGGTNRFAQQARYEVYEGDLSGAPLFTQDINQSTARGWVRLGGARSFSHRMTATGAQLRVVVTTISGNMTGDNGRYVYADAIRFVGAVGGGITSTPVLARVGIKQPGGAIVATDVALIAAENGRIYCVDARGNPASQTTKLYWTYPTTPRTGATDPNQVSTLDGQGPTAIMPSGFDMSSALVVDPDNTPNGNELLYIAATNGRIYCVEMSGRGDFVDTTGIAGSTQRRWTYPNDFPATPVPSNLGAFKGSLVYDATGAGGQPTIYAPTTQGRIFALDAFANNSNRTTSVRWAFPLVTDAHLGAIDMTPAIAGNRLFFGTEAVDGFSQGRFFSINKTTGVLDWEFTDPVNGLDDFTTSSPTFKASVAHGGGVGTRDTVYVMNSNRILYAINAVTGTKIWATNEAAISATGSPVYTKIVAYDRTGTAVPTEVVVVPTDNGLLIGYYARLQDYNVFTVPAPTTDADLGVAYRTAWGYASGADSFQASLAQGYGYMYAADTAGYLFAFSDTPTFPGQGEDPGDEIIPPNDINNPDRLALNDVKIKFISKQLYERFRKAKTDPDYPTYAEVDADMSVTRDSFEWGETLYMVVYNYPYEMPGGGENPLVGFQVTGNGINTPPTQIMSRQFNAPVPHKDIPDPANPGSTIPVDYDGFAPMQFPLQSGGDTAVTPGPAKIIVTMQTGQEMVSLDPAKTQIGFFVANPLALIMANPAGNIPTANLNPYSVGLTQDPTNEQNKANFNPGPNKDKLLSTVGTVEHGETGNVIWAIVDRSLMTLLRGPGRGLDNVRVQFSDVAWQGGVAAVVKPLVASLFPNFEDLPVNSPNNSRDYPNLSRDGVSMTKELFGDSQNLITQSSSLKAPVVPNWGTGTGDPTEADKANRQLQLTVVDQQMAIPKYQPANLWTTMDSAGNANRPGGYLTNMLVFVDSNRNGSFNRGSGRRDTARLMNIAAGVNPSERMYVGTDSVKLGEHSQGTGFSPLAPWQNGSPFTPWNTNPTYSSLFQDFTVFNDGNVNMLNLRLAKATSVGGTIFGWPILPLSGNTAAYLDGSWNLWSDLDLPVAGNIFAPMGSVDPSAPVILQKPQVGDRSPTELTTNPRRRANPFLGVDASLPGQGLVPGFPARNPRVAVTVPIGTPSGVYSQLLRVIESGTINPVMPVDSNNNSLVPFTDPSFTITYSVGEGRLTNSPIAKVPPLSTLLTSPMVDNIGNTVGNPFQFTSTQPSVTASATGNMAVAFSSNRGVFNPTSQPTTVDSSSTYRIYISSLVGNRGAAQSNAALGGTSPLRDLNTWIPGSATNWFTNVVGPYPADGTNWNTLFNSQGSESVLTSTLNFGAPAFAAAGTKNSFTGQNTANGFMAFIGDAQKQTSTSRVAESRIFLARYNISNTGAFSINAPVTPILTAGGVSAIDPFIPKSHPSVLQAGSVATIFFAGAATNQSQIYYISYDGGWTNAQTLSLGQGFESAAAPSASGRVDASGTSIIDLTFSGKVRGRTNFDIYYGRWRANALAGPNTNLPLEYRGTIGALRSTGERLESDGNLNTFRSRGISWVISGASPLRLMLRRPNVAEDVDLEVANSRAVDGGTGLITFDCRLGGKVYLDPSTGSIRFTSAAMPANSLLYLEYQPRFIRINEVSTVNVLSPTVQFDSRLANDSSYWARPNGQIIQPTSAAQIRNDRYIFTYGRSAAGGNQGARPYMKTMRLGVQLDFPMATLPNGNVVSLTVNGMATTNDSFFQADPANGRVYFTSVNEGATVTVNYTAVNVANGQTFNATFTGRVQMVEESGEIPVPIDRAVNEVGMQTYIDPLDWGGAINSRRPGLIWMFWTSTRTGGADVYFQTLAPNFAPVRK